MYNRKLNKLKSKSRNLYYGIRSAVCGKIRGHKFTSELWKGSYDGMGYFCDYCGAESDKGQLVEAGRNVPVWDGVLKCETCKLETCKDFRDIQDVESLDCEGCEDYERDFLKTLKHPFLNYYNAIKYYRSRKRTKKRDKEILERMKAQFEEK